MKTDTKLYSLTLTLVAMILFLILVSSTASASVGNETSNGASPNINQTNITKASISAAPKIIETRITTHKTASNPDIYGNIIVWQDKRNGNWDIYIFDLLTKKEIHTTNLSNQTFPAIYGNRVVWEDERNGGHDIYLQDLFTKAQTRITKSGKAINPSIYGDRIVWADGRNGGSLNEWGMPFGNWDIYMYNISTRKEIQITTNTSTQAAPCISGNRIVWEDDREWGGNQIGMYDLSTHKETLLDLGLYIYDPIIYGNKILWVTEADNIAMYDLSTSNYTHIAPYDISTDPAIYENKVVYDYIDRSSGDSETRLLDLSTMKQTLITKSGSSPKIYGNRIVWQDRRNGGSDIYIGTLIYPPVAAFSASPTSGKAPLTVKFTDKSTGSPTFWAWNFGDKGTLSAKNAVHKYTKAGKYTVSVTVKNAAGSNTKKIANYITVK
jgi:beta propeller repeat protein